MVGEPGSEWVACDVSSTCTRVIDARGCVAAAMAASCEGFCFLWRPSRRPREIWLVSIGKGADAAPLDGSRMLSVSRGGSWPRLQSACVGAGSPLHLNAEMQAINDVATTGMAR
jgi:hypothetical protein